MGETSKDLPPLFVRGQALAEHHRARIREAVGSLKMEIGEEPAELTAMLINSIVARCLTLRFMQGSLAMLLRSMTASREQFNRMYDATMEPMYGDFQRDIDMTVLLLRRAYGLTEKQVKELAKFVNRYTVDILKDVDAHVNEYAEKVNRDGKAQ